MTSGAGRVRRRIFARVIFYVHLAFVLLLATNPLNGPVTAFFGFLLIINWFYSFNIVGRVLERATLREIEWLRQQGYEVADAPQLIARSAPAKRKRDLSEPAMRLSDDGELVEVDDDDEAEIAPMKRKAR